MDSIDNNDGSIDPMSLAAERLRRRDEEARSKQERLTALIATLRKGCLEMGGKPHLVSVLHVEGLLGYYEQLFERREAERRDLHGLMQQPPEAA